MKLAKSSNARKGFSLPELIAVIVVIAVLGGIALNVISGLSDEAKTSKGNANVAEMNRLVANIKGAGGSVGVGASNAVDTTSVSTAVASLKAGYTPPGTSIRLAVDSTFALTEASYSVNSQGVFSYTTSTYAP